MENMGYELTKYMSVNITFFGLRSYVKTNRHGPVKDFGEAWSAWMALSPFICVDIRSKAYEYVGGMAQQEGQTHVVRTTGDPGFRLGSTCKS